jgi:mono/diheme cytochrome c family protein
MIFSEGRGSGARCEGEPAARQAPLRLEVKVGMMKFRQGWIGIAIGLGSVLWFMPAAPAQDTAADKAKIEAGETVYNTNCAICHGDNLKSSGQFPNLRRLTANDRGKFDTTVRNGRNQMPPWKDVLSDAEIDQIWHYIRANAIEK